jgi:glutamate racemase
MNAPIGIFDSGLGGLNVFQAIKNLLPNENLVYFGDTARLPYGSKSPCTIQKYSIENTLFLLEKDIKALVIACNTASAYSSEKLRKYFNIPIVDVIYPVVNKAIDMSSNGNIAILGTQGTIKSKAYEKALLEKQKNLNILSIACPLFVPFVEEQMINHKSFKLIAEEYLKPLSLTKVDTIILACTHYPNLMSILKEICPSHIQFIDSAQASAEELKNILIDREVLNLSPQKESIDEVYVSDAPESFNEKAQRFLNTKLPKAQSPHSKENHFILA